MGITITDVKTISLAAPLDEKVSMSFGSMSYRPGMLVRVYTSEGITGTGETWVNYPHWAAAERRATVEDGIKPLIVGESPIDVPRLWEKMYRGLSRLALQWGATGPVMQAISGVEIALWDIAGKYAGKPLYDLLGGALQKKMKVYGSGLGPHRPGEAAARCVERGISRVKLKVGFGEELDVKNTKEVRAAIGPGGTLMVDANMGWTPPEAVKMIKKLEPFEIAFVEEPVAHDDPEGMAEVAASTDIPIAAGENVYTRYGFEKLLDKKAVRIAQPDVTKTGGVLESKIICGMANARGLGWAPHFYGNAVGLAATLHLFAATPGGMFVEYDATPNPLRDQILMVPIEVRDGFVEVPQGPGLGIEIDEAALRRFTV